MSVALAGRSPVTFEIKSANLSTLALRLKSPDLNLLAEELRLTQQALGEITGVFGADDLLGEIFSRFCIGK